MWSSVFFGLVDVQTDDLQLSQVAAAAAALLTDHHLRDTHTPVSSRRSRFTARSESLITGCSWTADTGIWVATGGREVRKTCGREPGRQKTNGNILTLMRHTWSTHTNQGHVTGRGQKGERCWGRWGCRRPVTALEWHTWLCPQDTSCDPQLWMRRTTKRRRQWRQEDWLQRRREEPIRTAKGCKYNLWKKGEVTQIYVAERANSLRAPRQTPAVGRLSPVEEAGLWVYEVIWLVDVCWLLDWTWKVWSCWGTPPPAGHTGCFRLESAAGSQKAAHLSGVRQLQREQVRKGSKCRHKLASSCSEEASLH